jgi:antitoxin HigA-1
MSIGHRSAVVALHQRHLEMTPEFLEPMGLSVYAPAKAIHVTRSRINDICNGRQGVTAAIALRLGRFFNVDPQWFMSRNTTFTWRPSG